MLNMIDVIWYGMTWHDITCHDVTQDMNIKGSREQDKATHCTLKEGPRVWFLISPARQADASHCGCTLQYSGACGGHVRPLSVTLVLID
jgi:hypothetical protein